jgi:cobyrinic acid a,c-diamide synthase
VRVIGCLPRDENLRIPSRHLGLLTVEENPLSLDFLDHLVTVLRDRIDFGLLWEAAAMRPGDGLSERRQKAAGRPRRSPVPIAVARDAAFCFVYEDNLRRLREAGAALVEFSPLQDADLPHGSAGLYLPGGYPEAFADTLAANVAMKATIREAVDRGLPVYAECGGFLYLTRGIYDTTRDPAAFHEFAGVFPTTARMLPRRKALGYREVELAGDTLLGPAGTVLRGHEFHYSEVEEMPPTVARLYRVRRPGEELGMEGYQIGNCLASYVHLHFGSCPGAAAAFVTSCRRFARRK